MDVGWQRNTPIGLDNRADHTSALGCCTSRWKSGIKLRVGKRLEPVLIRELGPYEARRALSNQAVARSVDEGYDLGFRSERSLYQWSLLQTSSAGNLGKDPRINQYLRSNRTGLSADGRLDAVFKRMAQLSAMSGESST
ncbi:hypothetical protein [Fulvimarina sp. MAC8]|uniref:hypothetical protein n=1 Tax=Fulvimarina sp. MAC8 TaxID=3162874 RepID=UPI0032EF517B